MKFSRSEVTQWRLDCVRGRLNCRARQHLRIGQDFFNYFQCHKVTGSDRGILDQLYELDGMAAHKLIAYLTDPSQ